jgi:hypothetical protein
MLGKIFSVKTDIVYRREESLNLFKGKKKLDKVVSGRVLREQIKLFGFIVRTKYFYQICCPQVNMNEIHEVCVLNKVEDLVRTECYNKVVEYSNRKHHA